MVAVQPVGEDGRGFVLERGLHRDDGGNTFRHQAAAGTAQRAQRGVGGTARRQHHQSEPVVYVGSHESGEILLIDRVPAVTALDDEVAHGIVDDAVTQEMQDVRPQLGQTIIDPLDRDGLAVR